MSFKKSIKWAILAMTACQLLGCSIKNNRWFRDRSEDYQQPQAVSTLSLPKDMTSDPFSEDYQIPD